MLAITPTSPTPPQIAKSEMLCVPVSAGGWVEPLAKNIDDPAEQNRFQIGQRGDDDVGDSQRDRQPALRSEQPKHASIDAKKFILSVRNSYTMPTGRDF